MTRREFHAALMRDMPFEPKKDTFIRKGVRFTQQQHWEWWLYDHSCQDAETIYNRVQEPRMLAWLARGTRIRPDLVARADAVAARRGSGAARCSAIRQFIPWSLVARALRSLTAP